MKYLKNAEVARLYNVSEKSVRNWMSAAVQGKAPLELYHDDDKVFIADTLHNEQLLESYTSRARKYRNSQSHKKITPQSSFYDLYSPQQVIDIISNLDSYREIPHQYRYIGPGGIYWTSYLHKLYASEHSNILRNTINLLAIEYPYIDSLTGSYDHINVVDIGVGNGLAVKALLEHLQSTGKLRKYIGIDISPALLGITEHNINSWFEGMIPVETHVRDMSYERFQDVIAPRFSDEDSTINIVLLLGGIFPNFRDMHDPLSTIRDSMSRHDILISSDKPDTETARKFFDFSANARQPEALAPYMRQVPDLLNLDPSFYEVEQVWDAEASARQIRIRLLYAVSIAFELANYKRTLHFEKGERILLWRGWHLTADTAMAQFKQSGFKVIQSTSTADQELIITVSKIKANGLQ